MKKKNFLTYVFNCQECLKSNDQVSGPKVCIAENCEQFPVEPLNPCMQCPMEN